MTDRDLKVVSWDSHLINDTTNYVSGFNPGAAWGLPTISPKLAKRDGFWPLVGGFERSGRQLRLIIRITGAAKRTLRDQLLRWFDPEDETPKQFVIEDEDGTNDRYVYAVCDEVAPIEVSGIAHRDTFLILLTVHGDVRWRSTSQTSDSWSITASGQTDTVTNSGTDDAYPIFEITPTAAKTGGYAYKRFVDVIWRAPGAATQYPVRFGPLDTEVLVLASKMQADGDDLRIFVDGVEVDRWLIDINQANTYIWVNMNFLKGQSATLLTAIAASGSIDSIEIGEGIYDWPESGICKIDDELFTWTARDLVDEKLTGITRAAKGTSMAAHTTTDTVYWVQHEVIITYGNSTVSAPDVDDDYEPAFNTGSPTDNEEWQYLVFGDLNDKRAARWYSNENITLASPGGCYTKTQRTLETSDEYTVIGGWSDRAPFRHAVPGWVLMNPCGIVNVAWSSGESRAVVRTIFHALCRYWVRGDSFWTTQYTVADPTSDNTWDTWSKSKDISDWSPADLIALLNYFYPSDVGVGQVDVYLNTAQTPVPTIGAEQGNYTLAATITNNTTGEHITVDFDMELNSKLIINTDEQLVTYDADDTPQFQAVGLSTVRRHWLKLSPGSNTLQFDDTGTDTVTFVTKFNARFY